jgi:queuine/archaeosine tRNA-ribosyltransferase
MFEITSRDGDARTGTLTLPRGVAIDTPAMLVYTRRGGALNLTPDLLEQLRPEAQALQLDVMHL